MRLARLSHRHSLPQKFLLLALRLMTRHRALDVVRTLLYRNDFFGGKQQAMTKVLLRGPSEWEVWERELMGAFVSKLNQCVF